MSVPWAFKRLGIPPTSDASEIRRAYAKLLKAMDVDADVDGYARLRNARDVALAHASGIVTHSFDEPAKEPLDDEAGETLADPGPDFTSVPVDVEQLDRAEDEDSAEPTDADPISAAQQRLIAILFPGGEQMYRMWPEEAEEALRCFEILKTDPRLEQIDILAAAGDWFAQVVGQSIPRSDPLVRPVADYFGWSRGEQVGVHPAVAAVVARANALDWRDRLDQRSHRLHRAWKEMTRPANENSKRGWVSVKRVTELLKEVRTRHPSLEGDMDWYRISLWENGGHSRMSWGSGALVIFFVLQIARFAATDGRTGFDPPEFNQAGSGPTTAPSTVYSPPSIDPETDITEALKDVTGGTVDADQLKAQNPKLYKLVRSDWDELRPDQNGSYTFMRSERTLFADLVDRGWASARYEALRHKMETDVTIARALPKADCAEYLVGTLSPDRLGDALLKMRRAVDAEVLLAVDPAKVTGPPPPDTYHYQIPGPVIDAAIKRSGMTDSQFRSGIKYNAPPGVSPETQCRARIALREAILAQPKSAGLAVMRDMQS